MSEQADELRALYETLRDMSKNKQVATGMNSPLMTLIMHKLVENCEVKKPCRTCGTPRTDYRYYRITGAGKLFMAAFEQANAEQPPETRSAIYSDGREL